MHVIEPPSRKARRKRRHWPLYVGVGVGLIVALGTVNYLWPLPAARVSLNVHVPAATQTHLAWPTSGQAAVAADGYGILGTSGDQTPLATASIAKVITALCVLQKAPLALDQTGPAYTVDPTDVALYKSYADEGGSLVAVQSGEQMTEYQALEALMLPSANNIADSLVRWVFGSQATYASYATTFLQQHGINDTHIGTDASGFDPSTTSTASDLTRVGLLAQQSPILMQIVGQKSAKLPVANTVTNYNTILEAALNESAQLATSLGQGFQLVNVTGAGQTIGSMQTAWGASAPIATDSATQLVRWENNPITERYQTNTHLLSGAIGTLEVNAGPNNASTTLRLSHPLVGPSFLWRLTRH